MITLAHSDPIMKKHTLSQLIEESWNEFLELSQTESKVSNLIVKPSIPILWFGNMERFMDSKLRVITVGINPSKGEFLAKRNSNQFSINERFPSAASLDLEKPLSEHDISIYTEAMNQYFSVKPYSWFDNFDKLLGCFNASYYYKQDVDNMAIHIDICTPIATNPTWGGLYSKQKKIFKNILFFKKLLYFLNPHIVIASINQKAFEEAFYVRKKDADYNESPEQFTRAYIRTFETPSIPLLIWGYNYKGTPFGGMDGSFKSKHLEIIRNNYFNKQLKLNT